MASCQILGSLATSLKKKIAIAKEQAFAVITRAETKRQKYEESRKSIQTRECGVQPNSLDEIEDHQNN